MGNMKAKGIGPAGRGLAKQAKSWADLVSLGSSLLWFFFLSHQTSETPTERQRWLVSGEHTHSYPKPLHPTRTAVYRRLLSKSVVPKNVGLARGGVLEKGGPSTLQAQTFV